LQRVEDSGVWLEQTGECKAKVGAAKHSNESYQTLTSKKQKNQRSWKDSGALSQIDFKNFLHRVAEDGAFGEKEHLFREKNSS
jgi:hypothetical protein